MKKSTQALAVTTLGFLLMAGQVFAVPTVGMIETFGDIVPGYEPGAFTVYYSDGGGISVVGNQLRITTGSPIPTTIIALTTDADWSGSYTAADLGVQPGTEASISFNFSAGSGATPSALGLYFTTTDGTEWLYSFTPGFGTHSAEITTWSASWISQSDPGYGETEFLALSTGIQSISRIGLYLQGTGAGGTYFLDDFEITGTGVPEPETIWMILAVALSLGITFRGRLAELAGQLKDRFVKS